MNIYKIAPIVMVLLFVAALGGSWQFYFRERLEQYAENQQHLEELEEKLNTLESAFAAEDGGVVDPEFVIARWQEAVEPWSEALTQRASFFEIEALPEEPLVPEDETPRFYYEEQIEERVQELFQYAWDNNCNIPQTTFGVPTQEQVSGQEVNREQAERWLRRFNFGDAAMRRFIDANALQINEFQVWPPRMEYGILEMRTVGAFFYMRINDLVPMLESFGREDQYYTVDALRITNTQLIAQQNPPLQIEMLLTQARFIADEDEREAAASRRAQQQGQGGGGSGGPGGGGPFSGGPGGGSGGPSEGSPGPPQPDQSQQQQQQQEDDGGWMDWLWPF
ncbi:MAG: hypothetical protein ACLFV4_12505 [Candidatus Hydrogenedentota bacterium]